MAQAVPADVPVDHAALADAFAVGEYYVRHSGADASVVPIVIGAGAIGLSAVAALARRDVGPIIVADFHESRLAIARELGAHYTVDPRERHRMTPAGGGGAESQWRRPTVLEANPQASARRSLFLGYVIRIRRAQRRPREHHPGLRCRHQDLHGGRPSGR